MTQAESKARAIIAAQNTDRLIDQFELTEVVNDPSVYAVRGWLMDELQARDAVAFDRWIDSMEDSPRSFFIRA